MSKTNIFVIFLIFISSIPSLVEAKTADEWINEGIELGQAGKDDEAIKAFDEELKINPQYAEAWNNFTILEDTMMQLKTMMRH
jgi:tetratricopeptide (TPR) repeat protein